MGQSQKLINHSYLKQQSPPAFVFAYICICICTVVMDIIMATSSMQQTDLFHPQMEP